MVLTQVLVICRGLDISCAVLILDSLALFPAIPNHYKMGKWPVWSLNRAFLLKSRSNLGYQGWPCLHVIIFLNLDMFFIDTKI